MIAHIKCHSSPLRLISLQAVILILISGWLVHWMAPATGTQGQSRFSADGDISTISTQGEKDARPLVAGQPIERDLVGDETHLYQITLVAGQYLRVVVEQRSVDLAVAVFAPDGKRLFVCDGFKRGEESVSLISEAGGSYRLEARAAEAKAVTGRYEISVRELRVATPQDRERLATEQAANQLMVEGKRLYTQGAAESLKRAVEKYEQALPVWRAARNQRGEGSTLSFLGVIYNDLGERQKALDYYQKALQLWREADDRHMLGVTLTSIGLIHLISLRSQEGLARLQQALPLLRESEDRALEASTLTAMGGAYVLIDPQRAFEYADQALPIWREVKEPYGEVQTLRIIGGAYFALGEKEKATEYSNRAADLLKTGAGLSGETTPIEKSKLAADRAFAEAERLVARQTDASRRDAIAKYEEALRFWRASSERHMEASALTTIGAVYSQLGEWRKAVEYLRQAISAWRGLDNQNGVAIALSALAEAYYLSGARRQASDCIAWALPMLRRVGERNAEPQMLYLSARLARDRGQFQQSLAQIKAALDLSESLRAGIISPERRAYFQSAKYAHYEFCIDLLMQMSRQRPSAAYDALALQTSERARARSLLDLLTEARAEIRSHVDLDLLKQERKLQQQLYAEERFRIERLRGQSMSKEQVKVVNEKIEALLRKYHDLGARLRQSNPRYADLKWPQPLSLAEIQRQALDEETLLLEYSLGEKRSFLWAVTPTSFVSFVLPKRAVIEAAAQRVTGLLTARNQRRPFETDDEKKSRVALADAEYPLAAAALSRMLLGPVAPQLGKKRLLIVSDGELQSVPFAALPSPGSERRVKQERETRRQERSATRDPQSFTPLIAEREIIHLPSASTLVALRRDFAARPPAARNVAVLADPVFNQNDERVKASQAGRQPGATAPSANAAPNNLRTLADAIRLLGTDAEEGIPRLKHTRQEADAITSFAPATDNLKALDFKASHAMATSAELSHYRFVHFATHGLFDSERPELSGLLFSLVDEQGQPQNGLLQLHEVYNLKLRAELVVLSACQTALGKVVQGEGLIGLTRGFMYAGAPHVVASLWEVTDLTTAELMERFYKGMLRDGLRPAAALRAAQEAMWQGRAPYYWAAFTLQGEWK